MNKDLYFCSNCNALIAINEGCENNTGKWLCDECCYLLKPCPFCGSNNVEYFESQENDVKIPYICCLSCGIGFQIGSFGMNVSDKKIKNKIIKKWNSRVKN